jgi:hypothetical protein
MTQGVLGERIWLAKTTHPIPDHHASVSRWLNIAAGISVLILAKGLLSLDLGFTIAGLIGAMGAKLWFLDRMVWLRHDMEPTASPE